jgi:hypothetical protein
VPWFEATLSSPLSVMEVCERVADRLDNRLLFKSETEGFTGAAGNGRILVSLRGRSSFLTSPSLAARVEPHVTEPHSTEPHASQAAHASPAPGCHLRIRLRPGVGTMLWLGAWSTILGLVTAALVVQRNLPAATAVLIALLLPWALCSWLFRRQAPHLLALLEDACEASRLPSEQPRTF